MDALILLVQSTQKESMPCSQTLATTFTAEPQYSSEQKTCPVTVWPKATITTAHFLQTTHHVNNRNSSSFHRLLNGKRNKLLQHFTLCSTSFPWCLLQYFTSPQGSQEQYIYAICSWTWHIYRNACPIWHNVDADEWGPARPPRCWGILISQPIFCCVKLQLS